MPGDKSPVRVMLRADKPLLHEEGACLPLRSRHGQCRACASACPAQALEVSLAEVTLGDACTGCGQCTAACPTEALSLPELAFLSPAAPQAEAGRSSPAQPAVPVILECRKVPADLRAPASQEVPCLGAVRASHLVALSAGGSAVQLMDRGWCETCDMGCHGEAPHHPAQAALDLATLWLEAVDAAAAAPQLVREPLPAERCPQLLPPAPETAEKLDRRSFFRQALERPAGRSTAVSTPMGGDGKAAYPADRRQASPDRQRLLTGLGSLAERSGNELPSELYPQMHVNATCCDQRLCVALCPTAALTVRDNGIGAHLQFSSESCIACGTCVRACPTGAIQLAPTGGRRGAQTVFSHVRRPCASCGDVYTPDAAQLESEAPSLCPSCAKSQRFMDDARKQLFGGLN
ncbi:4Fe-4S binding protein [Hydrogenophaga palleronii]|nr:4Fe-4S binding protein [Hydrogenophaga palleronii]